MTDEITVRSGNVEKKIPVKLKFKLVDQTWSGGSGRTFFGRRKHSKCTEKAAECMGTAEGQYHRGVEKTGGWKLEVCFRRKNVCQ